MVLHFPIMKLVLNKMETRFDAAAMFALSIVLLVFSTLDVNADIPDGVVYTDVRKIVIEGEDAVLKCQFYGTPLAVYWKKGSDPESAPNLITWFGNEPHTGSCVEDGACEMADDFSMILKKVEIEDQGRYICRVSNYMGFLIHNFTDVKVIDPDQLSIHTEPYVTGWTRFSVKIPCNFTAEAKKVIWERVYWDGGSKVETILRYTADGHEAPAAKRYSWSKNYGLIIRDLRVSDEGNFTCLVSTVDGIEMKNTTVLVVNVSATKSTNFIIAVVAIIVAAVFLFIFVMIRMRQYKTFTKGDKTGTGCQTMTRDWFRWVFCWKKPDGCDVATKMQDDTEHAELPVDIEMKTNTEQCLMGQEKKLDNMREYLKNYQPGNDMKITKGFPPVINLGVFGIMGVGKSSLINSLNFALNNKYENVVVSKESGGAVTLYRESVPLTEHINIIDNRGMKDFSERQIDCNFMPEIRGERGQDPGKEIMNGDVIHCPIFVHDIRSTTKQKLMRTFLDQFSRAVHAHYGHHVMVVFTHKEAAKGPEYVESCINETGCLTDVPVNYISSFENYTENNHNHDVGKNIDYLEFLEKCLKIGERNIHFEIKKNKEVGSWCLIQ